MRWRKINGAGSNSTETIEEWSGNRLSELDFGGGHKIITHVIWATDEDDDADKEHKHR